MAVVGLVLLIACSNVENLLFARGAARKKEIIVRLALGAGRWRLVRQLVTESSLLALMGAAVGLLAASWAGNLLVASLSTERVHIAMTAGLSGRVLFFTGAILVLTILLCGLMPAYYATRGDLAQELKVQAAGAGRPSSRSWMRQLPVVAQVALSVTILAGAGLLLHSLVNLETFDAGFDRNSVLTVALNGSAAGRTTQQAQNFYDQLLARVKNLPGVRSASFLPTRRPPVLKWESTSPSKATLPARAMIRTRSSRALHPDILKRSASLCSQAAILPRRSRLIR